ncbi:unnamed protein product [Gongylonema pulchrum]|uniref:Myosin motor domain-containing protein n=1 Tax=Gongylonema pulchrum TaxID=637853 RepID=A0A183CUP9_9BILA|nr:unnamed protein product [Gongylonema pulchrum]
MDYDDDMVMKGAQIQSYLLEKSRVVKQNEGDRNFHIFYQLLSDGFDDNLRYSMGLDQDACAYRFLSQGGKTADPEIDDIQGAVETLHAMDVIQFSKREIKEIFEVLAGCVLLGEINFAERTGFDITYVDGTKEVETACRMLDVKTKNLVDALTQPSMKVNEIVVRKSQNLAKTLSSLSALCKTIYERLFNWILSRCNSALCKKFHAGKSARTHYIGVLDIAGFEIIKKNSFEQFCINYTNEKLQQFFNDFMFIREQREYLNEGIEWKHADYGIDMQNTIELIEKEQLMNLLETLRSTSAHFIRCIAPNRKRLPGVIDPHLVLHQLRCNGVLEGIRICRQGYPNRIPFDDFVARYRLLVPDAQLGMGRNAAERLCHAIDLDSTYVQIGKTKVYCKVGVISELENRRKDRLNLYICGIQSVIRWYLQQQRHQTIIEKRDAVLTIQENVRCFAKTSSWRWYQLLLSVKELIPLNKHKIRLEELQNENDELLKLENEKILHAKENDELKEEMARHEQLMELMEKRFDEQHAKVMKIHSCLRENEKRTETIEDEKKELENQLCKVSTPAFLTTTTAFQAQFNK